MPAILLSLKCGLAPYFDSHAKYHGAAGGSGTGISGLLRNTDAMRRKHERAMFLEVTFSIADMLNESDSGGKHKYNHPSEIQKSEKQQL